MTLLLGNKKTIIDKRKDIRGDFFFKTFYFYFECFYDRSHVNSRNNRREDRPLVYSYIGVKGWRGKAVPSVGGCLFSMIAIKKVNDVRV